MQGWIKGIDADLRPLSVRQPQLHLTPLWRPAKPAEISSYRNPCPVGTAHCLLFKHLLPSMPPFTPTPPTPYQTISQVKVDGRGRCTSPKPVSVPPQRELSHHRMPNGEVLPYNIHKACCSCVGLHSTVRTNTWREVNYLQMMNLNGANKGGLRGLIYFWKIKSTSVNRDNPFSVRAICEFYRYAYHFQLLCVASMCVPVMKFP